MIFFFIDQLMLIIDIWWFGNLEHIMGIIVSLLKNLSRDNEARIRLINKFIENDYEKVDRLLEMREIYETRAENVNKEIEEEKEVFFSCHLIFFIIGNLFHLF